MKNVKFLPLQFRKLNPEIVTSKSPKNLAGDTSIYYEQKRIADIVPLCAWMEFTASPGDILIRGCDSSGVQFEEFGWYYTNDEGNTVYKEAATGFYELVVILQMDNIIVCKVKDNETWDKQHLTAIDLNQYQMSLSLLPEDCMDVFEKIGANPVDIRSSHIYF